MTLRLKAGFSTAKQSPINFNGRLIRGGKTGPHIHVIQLIRNAFMRLLPLTVIFAAKCNLISTIYK